MVWRMRTTIELRDDHRAKLLDLAARRGEKGFSAIVAEAIEVYLSEQARGETRRKAALGLKGSLSGPEAEELRRAAASLRESWR